MPPMLMYKFFSNYSVIAPPVVTPNNDIGIFWGGLSNTNSFYTTSFRYNFSNYTVGTSSTRLGVNVPAGGSSSTTAISNVGSNSTTSATRYSYASDSWTGAGSLSYSQSLYAGAAGNNTVCVFAGGRNNTGDTTPIALSSVYTYGSNTAVAGTNLQTARAYHAACGNSTFGIYASGQDAVPAYISTSEKYTYSNNGIAGGTALAGPRTNFSAASIVAEGIFVSGSYNPTALTVDKYAFSSGSVTGASSLNPGRYNGAMASGKAAGVAVFFGGLESNVTLSTVRVYSYSSNTWYDAMSTGTAERKNHGGTSNAHGGI